MHWNIQCIYVFEISLRIKFQVIGYAEPAGRNRKVSNSGGFCTNQPIHAEYILAYNWIQNSYINQLMKLNDPVVVYLLNWF